MVQALLQLFQHQAGSGKKSTALQPIIYLAGFVLLALIVSFQLDTPLWLSIALFVILGIIILLFVGAYIYFMFRNPDALRSEKFNITKFAMERGLIGDNILGAILSFEEKQSLPRGPDEESSS